MKNGKVKMVFPGGNTCLGFYSFYDNIIDPDANRIYVIKGGPGVGKSTFMQRIGEDLQARGYDLEFHWCSSDNDSLDAVVIPALGVALIDGTAPHVVDPRNPGAVDEIINLGEFWDVTRLAGHRDAIMQINRRVGQQFAVAYSSLRMAKLAREEERASRSEAFSYDRFNQLSGAIFRRVFGERLEWGGGHPRDRHLFASALTPNGIVHHLPTVLDGLETLLVIEGEAGSGKEYLLPELAVYAFRSGLQVEVYHCAFDPCQVDLVVLPQQGVAVLNLFPELNFDPAALPGLKTLERYDTGTCLDPGILSSYAGELAEAREIYQECLHRALRYIRQAKEFHDEMEGYYIEAMRFEGVEAKRQEILERILHFAPKTSG